jgi:hypothetical protein
MFLKCCKYFIKTIKSAFWKHFNKNSKVFLRFRREHIVRNEKNDNENVRPALAKQENVIENAKKYLIEKISTEQLFDEFRLHYL